MRKSLGHYNAALAMTSKVDGATAAVNTATKKNNVMMSYLATEYSYFHKTQHTPRKQRHPIWGEGFAPFPQNWSRGLELPASPVVGALENSTTSGKKDATGRKQSRPNNHSTPPVTAAVSQARVLAKAVASAVPTLTPTEVEAFGVPPHKVDEFTSMLETALVMQVPVTGEYKYNPKVDGDLTPAGQFAIRLAAKYLGATSPAELVSALDDGSRNTMFFKKSRIVEDGTKMALWEYLIGAMDSNSLELQDVVQLIACQNPEFDLRLRDEKMIPRGYFKTPRMIYLDVSDSDAYLQSLRTHHTGDRALASGTYREFLAAPIRLKEKWTQLDMVVIPVIQGIKEPSIFTASSNNANLLGDDLVFKDLAVTALRDHCKAQETVTKVASPVAPSEVPSKSSFSQVEAESKEVITKKTFTAPPSTSKSNPAVQALELAKKVAELHQVLAAKTLLRDLKESVSSEKVTKKDVMSDTTRHATNPASQVGSNTNNIFEAAQDSLNHGVGDVSMRSLKMAALLHKKHSPTMKQGVREDPEFAMTLAKTMDVIQLKHREMVLGKKSGDLKSIAPLSPSDDANIFDVDSLLEASLGSFTSSPSAIPRGETAALPNISIKQQHPKVVIPKAVMAKAKPVVVTPAPFQFEPTASSPHQHHHQRQKIIQTQKVQSILTPPKPVVRLVSVNSRAPSATSPTSTSSRASRGPAPKLTPAAQAIADRIRGAQSNVANEKMDDFVQSLFKKAGGTTRGDAAGAFFLDAKSAAAAVENEASSSVLWL